MIGTFSQRTVLLLIGICLLVLLPGCQSERKNVEQGTIQITDVTGRSILLDHAPEHIAVLPIPWASMIYAIDGTSEHIAAIHPDAMKAYTGHLHSVMDKHFGTINHSLIGANFEINAESAANAGIDAVILWTYQSKEAVKINQIGVPAIMIDNTDMESLQKSITIIGAFLGKPDRARQMNGYYDTAYQKVMAHQGEVAATAVHPLVLFLRNKKLRLQGTDNFMHEAIEMGGGRNLVPQTANSSTGVSISMEEVYRIDPDIILLSNFDPFTPDDFYANNIAGQDWSQVKAVKDHRVYKVPMGLYRWDAPGVETPLMIEWLARLIQPGIFQDFDVLADTKQFYKEFLGYDLTPEDCSLIFTMAANHSSKPVLP